MPGGGGWLPHVAFLLVTQSLLGLQASDSFLTEIPAAALMVTVSCLGVLTLARGRVLHGGLLGLALAALALTKIVFLYFWPLVVAGLIAADLLRGTFGRRTMHLAGVFLVAHFLPIGGWMARNFVQFDEFSVQAPDNLRVKEVLRLRVAYNSMRNDEFAAGFWYYTPYRLDLGIPKRSWERLRRANENGFRRTGLGSRLDAPEIELLADPWRHLKLSTLMAWRGLFVQARLGYGKPPDVDLLQRRSLPRELRPSLPTGIARVIHRWGREAYVVWFRERGTIDGYGEAELKEYLGLETVAELPEAVMYRVPPPDGFARRHPLVSEFLDSAGALAAAWSNPSGMLRHFRELPLHSLVLSNRVRSLPSTKVAVPRLADVLGLSSWPRWGWRFGSLSKTLVNLAGGLALLVVPLWFLLARRRVEFAFAALPALYMHGVYALVSHFLPRYAQPEVPLRIWALLLLVCLVASSVRRLGGRVAGRPGA